MIMPAISLLLAARAAAGAFSVEDDGTRLALFEGGKPVLVYHYLPSDPPPLVPDRFRRACYLHPVYGLDGEEMTQDYPLDHFHHRGVFWAWPESTVGGRKIDVWALDGARQIQESMEHGDTPDGYELKAVNRWAFDDDPGVAQAREQVRILARPATDAHRAIDVELTVTNVSGQEFVLRGSSAENKGYGGFCLRPNARRRPMRFTAPQGVIAEDALELDAPWVDVSYPMEPGGDRLSGAAIFQHPGNPGYPHPGWILRHYGFLGQSWPHTRDHVMAPGDAVTLRYRLLIHRGDADEANVAQAFADYVSAVETP